MNRVAAKAGAKNSVFLNPHGLTQMGHHSTARDLAMIAAYGMKYQMFRDKVANDYYKVPYQNRTPETIRTTNHFIRNKISWCKWFENRLYECGRGMLDCIGYT